ncbi:MAG: hypothetical protein PHG00_16830 [Methylococcales bacterium]|nr:hypothetical protein [Methylococcales bacterium]
MENAADAHRQSLRNSLEICCTEWVADYLAETLLSANQKVQPETDDWLCLTATVK